MAAGFFAGLAGFWAWRDTSFTPAPFLDNEYLERLFGGVKVRSLLIKLVHDAVGSLRFEFR